MKAVTLIAVIALILEIIASLYFKLTRFKVFEYNETIGDIMNSMYTLGTIGLLIFFIRLYQKQSN